MANSNKKVAFVLLLSFELAVILPLSAVLLSSQPRVRRIAVEARKFGYTPSRIHANRGDTIFLSLSSRDVSHGFKLDGYPLDLIIRKGVVFQKNAGHLHGNPTREDWNRVPSVRFVADRPGKFVFRCTQTCGNLHPFMTGELIVGPNIPYHLALSLSIWIVFAVLFWVRYGKGGESKKRFDRIDVLERLPLLKRMVFSRSFHFLVILPNFVVFYLFILSSLWGSPVGNRNIAIVFVWILWWFLLKAVMVPFGGRIWCLMCPLPAPAEWISRLRLTAVRYVSQPLRRIHHRFLGLQKDWPLPLRNIWLQNILFMALISFGMILITRPVATAVVFIVILGITVILALIFRHRVFCLYLCPVGGFLGTYSMAAMTEVRAVDPVICKGHREKTCLVGGPNGWACPWNQYVGKMSRNNYCGLCTECIKSCPKENVSIFLRPFGSDRYLTGYDELVNVSIMLAIAIAFTVTMLGPWGFIKDAANVTESRQLMPFLIYLGVIWGSALVAFPFLFYLSARLSQQLAGQQFIGRRFTLRQAFILIPVGIFAWIAFSLPAIMVNYGYIVSVFSDPLGLGWDLFGTADMHFNPLVPEWIPIIQGCVMLAGLFLGIRGAAKGLKSLAPDPPTHWRLILLPAIFAWLATNILLFLFMG